MGIFDKVLMDVANNVSSSLVRKSSQITNEWKQEAVKAAKKVVMTRKHTYYFDHLPESVEELKAMKGGDLKDKFSTAALTIIALNVYAQNELLGRDMLEYLNGPEVVSQLTIQFIADRFMDDKQYVIRSYLAGATPENNYTPAAPYQVTIIDYLDDYEEENYARLFVESSGADQPRLLILRQKPSTKEWFIWEFDMVLADIVKPVSQDSWA